MDEIKYANYPDFKALVLNEGETVDYRVGETVCRRFLVHDILGKGRFGHVLKVLDLKKNEEVALKVATNVNYGRHCDISHEAEILAVLSRIDSDDHLLWVRMFESFFDRGRTYIILEALGPSLQSVLVENRFQPFSLDHVRHILYQIIYAVEALHSHTFMHCDLKLENIVFVNSDSYYTDSVLEGCKYRVLKDTDIKLVDFGSAIYCNTRRTGAVQTPQFRAPEVVFGIEWDHTADVWSIGCIAYQLYTGNYLFPTLKRNEHIAMINHLIGEIPAQYRRSRVYKMFLEDPKIKNFISVSKIYRGLKISSQEPDHRNFFDLLRRLLKVDPRERIDLREALFHSFFSKLSYDQILY